MPKLSYAIVALIFFSSCKKEINYQTNSLIASNAVTAPVNTNEWYATYGIFDINHGYIPQDTLHEDSLIHNGYISIPYHEPSHSATINYDIPQNNYLDGD